MSGCAHSNDCEMPVSPGELCPVDGAGTDRAHEDLKHTKITEFDCEEEAGSRAPVKVADPQTPKCRRGGNPQFDTSPLQIVVSPLRKRQREDYGSQKDWETENDSRAARGLLLHGIKGRRDREVDCGGQKLRAQVCDGKRGPSQGFVARTPCETNRCVHT